MNDTIIYQSEFMDNMNISIVFKDNPVYEELIPIFDRYGYGFVAPELKTIILDGEVFLGTEGLNMDDLRFVEAHEIAHLKLGHKGEPSKKDELEADIVAYILLKEKGYSKSVEKLKNEFEYRHGIEFDVKLIDLVRNKIR